MSNTFGKYLSEARSRAKLTQTEAAEKISNTAKGRSGSKKRVSQALLAQYESGKIVVPDSEVVARLADLYKEDIEEFIFRIALDLVHKYSAKQHHNLSELGKQRLNLWQAALRRYKSIGHVCKLEERQIEAKAALVEGHQLLGINGLAEWERNYKGLEVLWIVAPNFLDDKDHRIREAVIQNIKKGVRYVYFIPEEETHTGRRFWALHREICAALPDMGGEEIEKQMISVKLEREEAGWITTNFIIANPHLNDQAVGFMNVRRKGVPTFAIRMPDIELGKMIGHLTRVATLKDKDIDSVLPHPKPRQLKAVHSAA